MGPAYVCRTKGSKYPKQERCARHQIRVLWEPMSRISLRYPGLWTLLGTALLTALLAGGCEGTLPTASTQCASGHAQIGIGEGFQEIICGCAETALVPVLPPNTLTCTVSAGSTVIFHYFPGTTTRQIVPTVAGSFEPSPMVTADADPPIYVHVIRFTTPATYGYRDQFLQTLQGNIVVL